MSYTGGPGPEELDEDFLDSLDEEIEKELNRIIEAIPTLSRIQTVRYVLVATALGAAVRLHKRHGVEAISVEQLDRLIETISQFDFDEE